METRDKERSKEKKLSEEVEREIGVTKRVTKFFLFCSSKNDVPFFMRIENSNGKQPFIVFIFETVA